MNDVRPIDADALITSLKESYGELRKICDGYEEGTLEKEIAQAELITFLEAIIRTGGMPALDYAPVVHGEWIPVWHNLFKLGYVKCSVCGHKEKKGGWAYCHCGAKMDGGKEHV